MSLPPHPSGVNVQAQEAAAGLAYGMPVVTRNPEHFGRIPRLEVISY